MSETSIEFVIAPSLSLNTSSMNDVFNALVLSHMQYALPVYYGHLLQDKNRIDASLCKAK